MKVSKLLISLLTAFSLMLFVGCGSGSGGGGGGGKITEENYEGMDNYPVTEDNLDEVMNAIMYAMGGSSILGAESDFASNLISAVEGEKTLRETYTERDSYKDTIHGLSGYMIDEGSYTYTETETNNSYKITENGNAKSKYFDYSEDNNLFLGGTADGSYSMTSTATLESGSTTMEAKSSGTIEFRGAYKGSLVINNFSIKYTEDMVDYNFDYKIDGSVVIKSNGKEFEIDMEKYYDIEELF